MSKNTTPGARRVVPRSRGALSGIALIVLGLWGALIPFVGPYFNFSFTPDDAWHWTAARGWLEVLPGAAAFVAGFLLLTSRSRATTLVAAWLGIAAGAWFAVGPQLQDVWHIGSPGVPAGSGAGVRALEGLALFTLLGVVVVYFAATAFGRLSVVSLRDTHAAERREAEAAAQAERERQADAARERDAAAAREQQAAEAAAAHERRAGQADERPAQQEAADVPVAEEVDAPTRNHEVDDHADRSGRGAPAVTQSAPQRGYEQPQAYPVHQQGPDPVAPADAPAPPGQGYAQPQQYDRQHGVTQPVPGTPSEQPADGDGEHEGLARRLFHRR